MKLYREMTTFCWVKKGTGPWQWVSYPVLELREGPWYAFLLERWIKRFTKRITTHYVKNYRKDSYLILASADDLPPDSANGVHVTGWRIGSAPMTDAEIARETAIADERDQGETP